MFLIRCYKHIHKFIGKFCTLVNKNDPDKVSHAILVEGNIGVGKSTFLNMFINDPVTVLTEPVDMWRDVQGHNLLELLFLDPRRWGFVVQSYIQLTLMNQHNIDSPHPVIMERSLYSARYCFIENLHRTGKLSDTEKAVLDSWFKWILANVKNPIGLVVYLRATPEVCYERIKLRARHEERNLPMFLLKNLHDLHEGWLIEEKFPHPAPVVIIDGNKDLDGLREDIENIKHYVLNPEKLKRAK